MPLPNHWQQTTSPRNNNTSVFGTKKRSPSERPAHIKPIIMEDVWEVLVSYVELGGGSEQHYNFLFSSRFRKASKKLSTFHQRWTSRLRQKLPSAQCTNAMWSLCQATFPPLRFTSRFPLFALISLLLLPTCAIPVHVHPPYTRSHLSSCLEHMPYHSIASTT